MFQSLRVRLSQGSQYIPDVRKAIPDRHRGLPVISNKRCDEACAACRDACPTEAISLIPFAIDLGRCVFCEECVEACTAQKIAFTPEPKIGAARRADLLVREGASERARIRASAGLNKLFGRSLKMRQLSAGGCNACELELNAIANVNFDVQRFGIDWVASPRHADALVVTGPLTKAMQHALHSAWDAMPEPRFLVAVGACSISGGLYEHASGVDRQFLEQLGPSLFVPGCPPHPLTFINAILDFLDIA